MSDTQVTGVVDLDTCGVQGNCVSLSTVEEQWFKEPNEMAVPVSVPVDNKLVWLLRTFRVYGLTLR